MKFCIALSAAAAMAAATTGSANIVTSNITSQEMVNLIDNESFVAEGRIGNNSMSGTHELALGPDTGDSSTLETAQFIWGNATPYNWSITVSGGEVTFELGGVMLINDTFGPYTDLFLRTRAADGSAALLNNLTLNGQAVSGESSAEGIGGADDDVLWIQSSLIDGDFTLTGTASLTWSEPMPMQSQLGFQIKAASVVPAPGALALLGLAAVVGRRRQR